MSNKACPSCGNGPLDITRYGSMMVLSKDAAFFSLRCPWCHSLVSMVSHLSGDLRQQARFAAIEVGAGMGRSDRPEA